MDINKWLKDTQRKQKKSSEHLVREPFVCADGWLISIQASGFHYCSPRSSAGPYVTVELGFPSEADSDLTIYAQDRNDPTQTIYPYVPVKIVEGIIEKHGGKDGRQYQ